MGWSHGSSIAEEVWAILLRYLPKDKRVRKKVAKELVDIFEDSDCDTICEVEELCELAHDHSDED